MLTDYELEAIREAARQLSFGSPWITTRLQDVVDREELRRKKRDDLHERLAIAEEVA